MDYNDYMNIPPAERPTGLARFIPAAVVVSAFIGFIALAWYAYHSGSQSMKEEDLVVVEADKTPMKDKPLDPGGMKFPNQDKTIFDNFSGNNQPAKVERVLPGPEEPMPPAEPTETTTWVNDKLVVAEEKKDTPATETAIKPVDLSPKVVAAAGMHKTDSVQPDKAVDSEIKSYSAPVKTEEVKKPEPDAHVAVKTQAIPKVAAGNAKVQLGAYRSEKEAQDAFAKLQKKFGELSSKKSQVVKADLGDKGIFYRLRVPAGATADAKALCAALSGKGQACITVAE